MLHKNVGIGDNHATHNWEYADAAARTGATGFVAGDVHKLALQLDDLSLWILVDTTPTWQTFGGPSAFTSLTDTPASYAGQAGKVVAVNGTGTALEFITGGGGYTDEQAQDAVGTILTDSSTVDFTYNDVGNTITAVIKQQMSVTSDASGLKLSGDSASPGNNKVYGTDGSGVKGWKNDPAGGGASRELLTAARTYYVRTDGSDSNDGLTNSSGGAFLTIQKAIDVVSSLDMSIYQVTIQVADGTYTTGPNTLKSTVGALSPIIQGNITTPSLCLVTTSSPCFQSGFGSSWIVKGFKLSSSASYCLISSVISVLYFTTCEFSTSIGHLYAVNGGRVQSLGNYSIVGGAVYHAVVDKAGGISIQSLTITITGTPAFTGYFALSRVLGSISFEAAIWSGSATGIRYRCEVNGVIWTAGQSTAWLPGNNAGSTTTGGVYA